MTDKSEAKLSDGRMRAGQRAVVTGAGSGIGRAIALALAERGLQVTLVGRNLAALAETAAMIGQTADPLVADIATELGRARVATACGGLDVLVHSAGQYLRTPFAALTQAAWTDLDAVNLHAPILLTSVCLSALRAARGQVVFINSTAVQQAAAGLGAYAAGKHALKAAADALRQEVNADGIRVLSVFPGRTDTPMQQTILSAEGRSARDGALIPPEDVAQAVVAALRMSDATEVTDIVMRPMRPL
jgi:NADP-dependent 3-hydroxy acid dehydrogenase YdfG